MKKRFAISAAILFLLGVMPGLASASPRDLKKSAAATLAGLLPDSPEETKKNEKKDKIEKAIEEIAKMAHVHGALMHTDAIQAAGKIPVDLRAMGADFMSLSAHKIGGPQGVGALIVADHVQLTALNRGGGQERGLRFLGCDKGAHPLDPVQAAFGRRPAHGCQQLRLNATALERRAGQGRAARARSQGQGDNKDKIAQCGFDHRLGRLNSSATGSNRYYRGKHRPAY